MVETASEMLELGTEVPAFSLPDAVSGETFRNEDFAGQPLLVMFLCNHCPFVQHVKDEIGRLAADWAPQGVRLAAINSNDVEVFPQDAPEHMKAMAEAQGWDFPFLFDESQEVAQRFRAACTPDFYLFDADGKLFYRGRLDASRPGSGVPVTGEDLRAALDALLAGDPAPAEQRPSAGCNIKWKAGNEPPYFG